MDDIRRRFELAEMVSHAMTLRKRLQRFKPFRSDNARDSIPAWQWTCHPAPSNPRLVPHHHASDRSDTVCKSVSTPYQYGILHEDLPFIDWFTDDLDILETAYPSIRTLRKASHELSSYIANNAYTIPKYAERHCNDERVSIALVESVVNTVDGKRFSRRQQVSQSALIASNLDTSPRQNAQSKIRSMVSGALSHRSQPSNRDRDSRVNPTLFDVPQIVALEVHCYFGSHLGFGRCAASSMS